MPFDRLAAEENKFLFCFACAIPAHAFWSATAPKDGSECGDGTKPCKTFLTN